MKVLAARADRDADDILTLCEQLKISSIEEVLATAERAYGSASGILQPRSRFLVEALLDAKLPYS